MDAESGLVPMPLYAPGKDANLVEVKRQPRLRRAQRSHIFRHQVIGNVGFGIVDSGKDVSTHDALPLGILPNLVGHIDVHTTTEQPARASLAVANQPPVFHRNFRGQFGLL